MFLLALHAGTDYAFVSLNITIGVMHNYDMISLLVVQKFQDWAIEMIFLLFVQKQVLQM